MTAAALTIDISTRCTLRCVMCALEHAREPRELMDVALLREIAEQLDPDTHVRLGWNGEPLVHPRVVEVVGLLAARVGLVEITTNGMLLDAAMADGLIAAGLDEMNLSVDGSTRELYESIRRGADFEQVLANAEYYRARLPAGRRLNMVATLFAENLHDTVGLVSLARRLGIDLVAFNFALPHFPDIRSSDRLARGEIEAALARAQAAHRGASRRLLTPSFQESVGCRFLVPVIGPAGDLSPCAMLSVTRKVVFRGARTVERRSYGSLRERTLRGVLDSAEYRAFVAAAAADWRATCPDCPMNTGLFCP